MNIRRFYENGIVVLFLTGRIDAEGSGQLGEELSKVLLDGHHKVILDMGQVNYLNTAGLHLLAEAQVKNQEKGGELRLARLSPIVQRVFQLVGFRRYFRNYSSVDTAMLGF